MGNEPDTRGSHAPLSARQASQLLSAVLGRHAQPIDRVLLRCGAVDGAAWAAGIIDAVESQVATSAGCTALKNAAKRELESPGDEGYDPAAFLRYLHAIAVAMDRHGVTITSAPPGQIAQGLRSLARVVAEPWSGLYMRAAGKVDPR